MRRGFSCSGTSRTRSTASRAVLQVGPDDFYVVGKIKALPETGGRDALVQHL